MIKPKTPREIEVMNAYFDRGFEDCRKQAIDLLDLFISNPKNDRGKVMYVDDVISYVEILKGKYQD